jgi:hypothetical protein
MEKSGLLSIPMKKSVKAHRNSMWENSPATGLIPLMEATLVNWSTKISMPQELKLA